MDKEEIRSLALSFGADAVGFGVPRVFSEFRDIINRRERLPFEVPDVERRINPFLHFPQAKGVVCILSAYRLYENELTEGEVKTASSSIVDYHLEVKQILHRLQSALSTAGIQSAAFCDTEGLLDKQIAVESGLGFIGKNSLLIHPALGSAVHIGYLLTDVYFLPDPVVSLSCGSCNKCIRACPKDAIGESGVLHHHACLSALTQNRKASRQYLEKFIYGCDLCLKACPYNKVEPRVEAFIYREEDFLLSHREFRLQYAQKEFAWLGRNLLQRNIQWNREDK